MYKRQVQVGIEGDLVQEARQGGLIHRILQVVLDGGEHLVDCLLYTSRCV